MITFVHLFQNFPCLKSIIEIVIVWVYYTRPIKGAFARANLISVGKKVLP